MPGIIERCRMIIQDRRTATRRARIERNFSTPSGINMLPELVQRARETGQVTIINPGSEILDSIPNMYGDRVRAGAEFLIVGASGVQRVPNLNR